MFSDHDLDTLNYWFTRRPAGLLDIVELEGFSTAIVIGPNLLTPNLWLLKVWGGKSPRFRDLEEMNRFTALAMNFNDEIAECFARSPAKARSSACLSMHPNGDSVAIILLPQALSRPEIESVDRHLRERHRVP